MKSLNVLVFKFSLSLGGGETFNFILAEDLNKDGNVIKFYSNLNIFNKKIRELGCSAKKFYWGRELGAIRYAPMYFVLLPLNLIRMFILLNHNKKSNYINIVVFQSLNEKVFGTLMARRLGYKVYWVEHLAVDPWLTRNILRNNYVRLSRLVDRIIVVSNHIREELVGKIGIENNKIEVVYNGVDTSYFSSVDPVLVENEKKKLGLYKDSKIIGFHGRLHEEKGLDILIRAFSEITRRFDKAYLLLVGEGSDRPRLESLSRSLGLEGKVIFVGFKNMEILPLYINMMDIFCLPSRVRESFGISIIEAMSASKPTVASNIGGIPEIIDGEEFGYLFEVGDEKELAGYLSKLLSDEKLRLSMGAKAFQRVEDKFSRKAMIENINKVFHT